MFFRFVNGRARIRKRKYTPLLRRSGGEFYLYDGAIGDRLRVRVLERWAQKLDPPLWIRPGKVLDHVYWFRLWIAGRGEARFITASTLVVAKLKADRVMVQRSPDGKFFYVDIENHDL